MSVSLIAVGDISFGDSVPCISFGLRTRLERKSFHNIFKHVQSYFKTADIVFGNLEVVLSDYGLNRDSLSSYQMRGKNEFISHITQSGINVLNIANNHILQHGSKPFWETVNALNENGICVVGMAEENGINCKPGYLNVRGKEFLFLGYCFVSEKYYKGRSLYAPGTKKAIISDIKRYKKADNHVICSFHWGKEFIDYPSKKQMDFAKSIIDAGCDLILGHHPHVIQGVEIYRNRPIFYSLGNFLFDMSWNKRCKKGLTTFLSFENGNISVKKILPVIPNDHYEPLLGGAETFKKEFKTISDKINHHSGLSYKEYYSKYLKLENENRYRSWLFLIKNFYKYKFTLLFELISTTMRKKLVIFKKNAKLS